MKFLHKPTFDELIGHGKQFFIIIFFSGLVLFFNGLTIIMPNDDVSNMSAVGMGMIITSFILLLQIRIIEKQQTNV